MFTPEEIHSSYFDRITSSDISRITSTEDGIYSFTIGTAQYHTGEDGKGLYRWQQTDTNMLDGTPVMEWEQILGDAQFTIGANPRAAVAEFALRDDQAYEEWLREEGIQPSKGNALKFLRKN